MEELNKSNTDKTKLLEEIATSVTDKITERDKQNLHKTMHDNLRNQNLQNVFYYSQHAMDEDFKKLNGYRDSEVLDDNQYEDMQQTIIRMGTAEDKLKSMLNPSPAPEPAPITKPVDDNMHMQANKYANIGGFNVPVSNHISSADEMGDKYPKHQREIDLVSKNGKRAYEHKDWRHSVVNTHSNDNSFGNSYGNDTKAFLTFNEEYSKLAQDLSPENADNFAYESQILSKKDHKNIHNRGSSMIDIGTRFENNQEALKSVRDIVNEFDANESIISPIFTFS